MTFGIDANEANVKNRVGSGVYAYELLKQFSKSTNHEFLVYLKEKPLPDLPKEAENFKYVVFGPKKFWTRIALPLKLAIGPKIDVFFTLGHYGPRFSKIPYAITIFDLSYLHFPQLFKKSDLYQLVNWSKHSILNSKHIFTISQSSKKDIIKNYDVNPSKITVTYPGYDTNRFKPQPKSKIESAKKKYKIAEDYIIFVGTLQPRKNIERLIEAFNIVVNSSSVIVHRKNSPMNDKRSTMNLVIAGKKGWMYERIFSKIKQLGLNRRVIFTDYVSDDDLPPLIAGAKAYFLPSLWEGFGIPVIEAQACGVPVVVSNVSSLPEIIDGSGILVDPENIDSITQGLKGVITGGKIRSDLVRKGFENIKRFSWEKCAEQTLHVLSELARN